MLKDKPTSWITLNGRHIPLYEGESKQDAVNRFIANSNEDKRQAEIRRNSEQAARLNREQRIAELQKQLAEAKGIFAKSKIQTQINMLKDDFHGTEEEYKAYKAEQHQKAVEASLARQAAEKQAREQKAAAEKENLERELRTQPKEKVEQYKIIQEHNSMNDDYHVGIRKPSDIKTWAEVLKDSDEDFAWGDFSRADAERALKEGKITIYSSYPIGQGVFVSTSKVQSEQYAGGKGKKVYSKVVPLSEVAWISGDEGQYAKRKGE